MRSLLGACSLLLLAPAALAQTPAVPLPQTILLAAPDAQACPVALHALRPATDTLRQVAEPGEAAGKPAPSSAWNLQFRPVLDSSVTRAELLVHGFAGSAVLPASFESPSGTGQSLTEAFTVTPTTRHPSASPSVDSLVSTSMIHVHRLTSVRWIELRSLKFANGTEWHETNHSTCGFVPSVYRLTGSGGN